MARRTPRSARPGRAVRTRQPRHHAADFARDQFAHADQRNLTAATSLAILLYAAHNAAATVASLAGGQIADRLNPRLVFGSGAATYALGYLLLALTQHHWPVLLIAFLFAGVGIGIAEIAESTAVAHALPDHLHGKGFGVLGFVQSLGDLGATLVAGLLWAVISPAVAFS